MFFLGKPGTDEYSIMKSEATKCEWLKELRDGRAI